MTKKKGQIHKKNYLIQSIIRVCQMCLNATFNHKMYEQIHTLCEIQPFEPLIHKQTRLNLMVLI